MDAKRLGGVAGPTYFLAILFVVLTAVDFVLSVWPLHPGNVAWRYGAVGLAGGFLLTPLLGLLLLVIAARYFEQRAVLSLAGFLAVALAVLLALGLASFVLDSLQMRRDVPADRRWMFDVGAVKALAKLSTGAVAAGWIGLAGLRGRKGLGTGGKGKRKEAMPLVVGPGA